MELMLIGVLLILLSVVVVLAVSPRSNWHKVWVSVVIAVLVVKEWFWLISISTSGTVS